MVSSSPGVSDLLFAVGKPPIVESTNPWLAWDNRPYVSAEELLKVPAASQSQMLKMYSIR